LSQPEDVVNLVNYCSGRRFEEFLLATLVDLLPLKKNWH
jgi:hypothetical protein